MREKIYYFNKETKTLYIKGFCKNSNPYERIEHYTEQEAIRDNRRFIHMCAECKKGKNYFQRSEGRIVK